MKKALLCLIALSSLTFHAQAGDSKQSTRLSVIAAGGTEVELDESKDHAVRFWVQQLVLSALYQDIVQASSLDEWQRQLGAVPRIACTYPPDSKIALPERQTLEFEDVVIPLGASRYPDYIYVRHGDSVLRLAKYDPWVFQKLMVESNLAPLETLTVTRHWF